MPDWLWHWLGYTVALAGFAGVLWALFWDRSRGRKRCRKCWYDLSGVAAAPVDCPECGRPHTKAKHLTLTRRRWWRAVALALVMVVGGYGLWIVPRVQDEGAWGVVPTTAVVVASPFVRLDQPLTSWQRDARNIRVDRLRKAGPVVCILASRYWSLWAELDPTQGDRNLGTGPANLAWNGAVAMWFRGYGSQDDLRTFLELWHFPFIDSEWIGLNDAGDWSLLSPGHWMTDKPFQYRFAVAGGLAGGVDDVDLSAACDGCREQLAREVDRPDVIGISANPDETFDTVMGFESPRGEYLGCYRVTWRAVPGYGIDDRWGDGVLDPDEMGIVKIERWERIDE